MTTDFQSPQPFKRSRKTIHNAEAAEFEYQPPSKGRGQRENQLSEHDLRNRTIGELADAFGVEAEEIREAARSQTRERHDRLQGTIGFTQSERHHVDGAARFRASLVSNNTQPETENQPSEPPLRKNRTERREEKEKREIKKFLRAVVIAFVIMAIAGAVGVYTNTLNPIVAGVGLSILSVVVFFSTLLYRNV